MRAMALDLMRTRDDADIDTGPFVFPPLPAKRSLTFSERGFSFIPLQQVHLELFVDCLYGRAALKIEYCVGRVMVDRRGVPLGAVLVYFESGGLNWLYAEFGNWLRTYPKDILRAMHAVTNQLRKQEFFILHTCADEKIAGSDTLIHWLNGELIDPHPDNDGIGPTYLIDLRKTPI